MAFCAPRAPTDQPHPMPHPRFRPPGAVTIAHALHHAASLRVLWLSGNRLGEEGGAALAEALPSAGWMDKGCLLEARRLVEEGGREAGPPAGERARLSATESQDAHGPGDRDADGSVLGGAPQGVGRGSRATPRAAASAAVRPSEAAACRPIYHPLTGAVARFGGAGRRGRHRAGHCSSKAPAPQEGATAALSSSLLTLRSPPRALSAGPRPPLISARTHVSVCLRTRVSASALGRSPLQPHAGRGSHGARRPAARPRRPLRALSAGPHAHRGSAVEGSAHEA